MIGKYPASPGGGKDPFRREQHVSRVIARPAAIALSSTPTAADPAGARGSIPRPLRFAARREATRPGKRPVMHRAPQSNCHDSLTFKARSGAAVMNCLPYRDGVLETFPQRPPVGPEATADRNSAGVNGCERRGGPKPSRNGWQDPLRAPLCVSMPFLRIHKSVYTAHALCVTRPRSQSLESNSCSPTSPGAFMPGALRR